MGRTQERDCQRGGWQTLPTRVGMHGGRLLGPGGQSRYGECEMKQRFILPVVLAMLAASAAAQVIFTGQELLSRVSNNPVTVNVEPDKEIDLYYESGPLQSSTRRGRRQSAFSREGQLQTLSLNARSG